MVFLWAVRFEVVGSVVVTVGCSSSSGRRCSPTCHHARSRRHSKERYAALLLCLSWGFIVPWLNVGGEEWGISIADAHAYIDIHYTICTPLSCAVRCHT